MKKPLILSKEEAQTWIAQMATTFGIKILTHPMGGCSAWKGGESLRVTGRHYGELRHNLSRRGIAVA